MKKFINYPLWVIGLWQAVGTAIYLLIVAIALTRFGIEIGDSQILGLTFFLLLMVFSVAVTATFVFGYTTYLAIHHKIKEALTLLAYTLLYLLGFLFFIFASETIFSFF